MKVWAHEELATLDLGDTRLNERCKAILEALAALPEASLPTAMASAAATKATYRFLKNEHFQSDAILQAHLDQTLQRCQAHSHILALQDTTTLNYSNLAHAQGLGYLGDPKDQGLLVHSVFLCSAEGLPLGLAAQQVWARPNHEIGKKQRRRTTPIEQKESYKWLAALDSVTQAFPEGPEVTVLSDQESDLFEYFLVPRPDHVHLLLRACHARSTPEGKLLDQLQQLPEAGRYVVEVPRTDSQAVRQAHLALRYARCEVLPPRWHVNRKAMRPVELYAVLAEEVGEVPAGATRLRWYLLTTRPVRSFEEACACVELYTRRWLIERFHYVLKSGCQLEALQLSTAARLERALTLYSLAGWRLMWMTYLARYAPETSCEAVFEPHEWQALQGFVQPKAKMPTQPPTIYVVVRWLAVLGGFQNRKGDGEPGVKVLWKGLAKFEMIAQTWRTLQQNPHLLRASPDVGNA